MESISSTTFKEINLGDVKPVILIGGNDTDFIPNVNMSFFSDEFYINLNNKSVLKSKNVTSVDGKISHKGEEWYVKDGRLKWDTVFESCPTWMELEYELKHSDNIKFVYQDSLENELKNKVIDQDFYDNAIRPDDVIGSYAVMCGKRDNKYGTGKVAHIYRPFVVDADGKKEWAILEITSGKLTIILPDAWMQSAKYPVRLDPVVGYSTAGASGYFLNNGGCGSVSASDGTGGVIQSFHCAIFEFGSGVSQNVKMAVCATSGGEPGGQDVLEQIEFAAVVSDTNTNAASGSISLNASTTYAVILASQAATNHPRMKYDSVGSGIFNSSPGTYASQFEDPLPNGWASNNATFSTWVTYEAAGGSSIPNIMHHLTKNVGAQ